MTDPMPTLTGTEIAQLKTLLNGQASAVDFRLNQTINELHAADSVAFVDDLPTTGNWLGRITFVDEDEQLYVCTSLPSTWVRLNYLDRASTVPTAGPGWGATSVKTLERRGGFAYLEFNAFRGGTDLAVDGVVVEIPAGYQGDKRSWSAAWHVDVAGEFYQVYYNPVVHKVVTRQVIPAGEPIAVSLMWPIL